MKKSLFVAAMAAVLVLAFSTSAFAVGPFFLAGTSGQNTNYAGYLSWNYIQGLDAANNVGTPHGAYTTTSNKCAVCHAVHRAKSGGSVLTAIPDNNTQELNVTARNAGGALTTGISPSTGPTGYTKGCAWCHNVGGFATTIAMAPDASIRPHTNCARCHTASPHGAGASEYEVLAARLLNEEGDLAISADLAAPNNNALVAAMFDETSATLEPAGVTLGTGYICNACHNGGSASVDGGLTFAVNVPGATPSIHKEGAAGAITAAVTGHRVTAMATTKWNLGVSPNAAKSTFNPANPWKYNAFYTGQGVETGNLMGVVPVNTGVSQIAWAASNSCESCHDQKLANGNSAFPHNYVMADGSTMATATGSVGSGYIWMTTAPNAMASKTVLAKDATGANQQLSEDGLCLKCHVKDGAAASTVNSMTPSLGAEGVGISF